MRDDIKDLSKGAVVTLVAGALAILLLIAFGAMWVFGFGVFQKETASFRGSIAATEKIQANGAYRIAAYNSFFDKCASVQSLEGQIKAFQAQIDANPPAEQKAILNNQLLGVQGARISAINDYNANSQKDWTVGQFKDSNLPYLLNVNGVTVCFAN
jgi:hypothetical protein